MAQEQEDPRDLTEGTIKMPDNVLIDRIDRFIERLQEHMEPPTLGSYGLFLREELEWIEHEKRIRRALARPLP